MLKKTSLPGISYWSRPQLERGIDFNGFLWARSEGNVLIDPLDLDPGEYEALQVEGGARWILLTNSDHLRAAPALRATLGAKLLAPEEERERFGRDAVQVDHWYTEASDLPAGLDAEVAIYPLRGGKSRYEAALYLRESAALVFGDLVRCHRSGLLQLLPEEKLSDRRAALESLRPLRELPVRAVLLGDGDSFFFAGDQALAALLDGLEG